MDKQVRSYLITNKGWIAIAIATTFLTALLEIPFPFIVRVVIDKIIVAHQKELLAYVIFALAVLIPLKVLISFIRRYYLAKLVRKSSFLLRQAMMGQFLKLELGQYSKVGPGHLASRVFEDGDQVVGKLYNNFIPMMHRAFVLIASLAAMFYVRIELALIPLFLVPLYIYFNIVLGLKLRAGNVIVAQRRAILFETFSDIIQSIFFTRSRGLENMQRVKFIGSDKRFLRSSIDIFKTETYLVSFNSLFGGIVPSIILVLGVGSILGGKMSLGDYFAFTLFLTLFLGSVQFFLSQNTSFQKLRVSYRRICEVFEWPIGQEFRDGGCKEIIKPRRLEFINVDFSYPNQEEYTLQKINLTIRNGEKVALMGKSGSGKSTLIKLILGLYEPVSGIIRYNDKPFEKLDMKKVRGNMAFVQQEPLLLEGTIEDNIRLFRKREGDTPEKMQACLELAHVHDLVAGLPNGLKTRVERFGSNFSVGERQRLNLASAIFREANLIIMDEPTSNIDEESTHHIMTAIRGLANHITVIIVSHDPDISQYVDRILVVEHGMMIDEGCLQDKAVVAV